MFRQMDMREALLSTAVKRTLLYDSQRQMRFLDILAVPQGGVQEKPVAKVPQRKACPAKGRRKRSKRTETERKLLRKVPEPKDPFTQLFPKGQKSFMPVCRKKFFQDNYHIGPIKPYSDCWNSVQPPQLVERLMAGMSNALPKGTEAQTIDMLPDPGVELVDCLEELRAQQSKACSETDRRISEVMHTILAESAAASGREQKLATAAATAKPQLQCNCEGGSKPLVPKAEQPQKQAPNGDSRKKQPKKRNRKRNKGYIAEASGLQPSNEQITDPTAEDAPKSEAEDVKTVATGDGILCSEAAEELGTGKAEQPMKLAPGHAELGTKEQDPRTAFSGIQAVESPSQSQQPPSVDNKKKKPNKRNRNKNKGLSLLLANKASTLPCAEEANEKTLDAGASGEPELNLCTEEAKKLPSRVAPSLPAEREIGAGDDIQLQQEQIVLAKDNSAQPEEETEATEQQTAGR
ncbi:uncharacterized protein LOC111065331 [Drosophila obscura]|uniref:uncharacterized protein LOC111065331 n=1 Tax=Drosophila obscura TaxID=7282 RepID=UPI001BB1E2A5|nr:uncharacterized protein LOC111065331 [Drosophila obscura]